MSREVTYSRSSYLQAYLQKPKFGTTRHTDKGAKATSPPPASTRAPCPGQPAPMAARSATDLPIPRSRRQRRHAHHPTHQGALSCWLLHRPFLWAALDPPRPPGPFAHASAPGPWPPTTQCPPHETRCPPGPHAKGSGGRGESEAANSVVIVPCTVHCNVLVGIVSVV